MNLSASVWEPASTEAIVLDLASITEGGQVVVPFLALLKVTAFQKTVAYGMYIWGAAVTSVYTLAFSEGTNALILGMLGAIAMSALFALRRLVMLMIQIGEAAAEKKLREIAATKTSLTEEEIHKIVVEEMSHVDVDPPDVP